MDHIATYNAALQVSALRNRPDDADALAILDTAGEERLARDVLDHAIAARAAAAVVAFLVDHRPDDIGIVSPPGSPELEALIADAQTYRDAIDATWPALRARVRAVADRIEASVPGAASADTGAA